MLAILIAGGIALLGTLLGTRLAIAVLVAKGYGQLIRDDGPTSHHTKRGTPTMGGTVIILAVIFGYAIAKHLNLKVAYGADNDPKDFAKVQAIIKTWIKKGVLEVEERKDSKGRDRKFIKAGTFNPDAQNDD